MKKKLLLVLTLILAACLMTGCVASETNIKIGMQGNIVLETTTMLHRDTISNYTAGQSANQEGAAAVDPETYVDQMIVSWLTADTTMPDDNEGVIIEKRSEGDMIGAYAKLEYKNWEQLMNSAYFNSLVTAAVPKASTNFMGQEMPGLKYEASHGIWGTTYKITGKYTMEDLKTNNGATAAEGMDKAKVALKITAPIFTAKSNSLNSSAFKTTHIWEMGDGGEINVDFSAFVPNLAVLIESLVILLLLIAVIVLAVILAGKNTPDDPEGDEIDGQISMEDGEMIDTDAENFFAGEEFEGEEFAGEEFEGEIAEEAEEVEVVTEEVAEEETTEE